MSIPLYNLNAVVTQKLMHYFHINVFSSLCATRISILKTTPTWATLLNMERIISVIGESLTSQEVYTSAERVGELLAKNNITVACGGLTGVMEAVCKGAKSQNGRTIGILPGNDRYSGNKYIYVPIITGIGYARNSVVAKTGQVAIAIGGWFGTLCEIAFALDAEVPVIGLNTWDIYKNGERPEKGIIIVNSPEEAVETALKLLDQIEQKHHGE